MPHFSGFCRTTTLIGESITRSIGRAVAWLTAVMAVVTAGIVLSRLLLGTGSIAAQESLTYMHALVIMLASAYTLSADGHVRVDIFYRHCSACQKAWVNVLGTALFLLPFALFTVMISWDYVTASWSMREASIDAGGIPAVFLLKSLLLANGGLLFVQGIAELMRHLNLITYSNPSTAQANDSLNTGYPHNNLNNHPSNHGDAATDD